MSLAGQRPDIAKELDYIKNRDSEEPTPDMLTIGSHKHKWWICSNEPLHSWYVDVKHRTNDRNCPHCKHKTESKLMTFIISYYGQILTKEHYVTIGDYNYRYDFYIPCLNLLIELDGDQHFKQIMTWKSCDENRKSDVVKMLYAWTNHCMILLNQMEIYYDKYDWKGHLISLFNYIKTATCVCIIFYTNITDVYERSE
jgi:hypothetical protein